MAMIKVALLLSKRNCSIDCWKKSQIGNYTRHQWILLYCQQQIPCKVNFSYNLPQLLQGPFKYYVIMVLTFFDPPTLSSDVIISNTHLKHDVIISSYPPTYLQIFFSLINKAKIRQGLFLLKKNYMLHNNSGSFFQKKKSVT